MLKSLVSGIKLYLDKRLKEQRDETDERIADAKWHETTATQLFSETVTTVDDGQMAYADLSYSERITADTLIVTFNGTEYICPAQRNDDEVVYGATFNPDTGAPNWDVCPFFIESGSGNIGNGISTETPGTYTVSASTETTNYTDEFKEGVLACVLKEVETPEEADIAVVTVTRRVASTNQGTDITIYKDNDTVQFLATSVNKYLDPGVYYFWKDSANMLSNFAYRLFPSNDGLLIMGNAEIDTSSGASSLNVYGIGNYGLTSSNASWKFYNIGLTPSSDGDGGDAPK